MSTNVVKGPQLPVRITGDHHRLADQIVGHEIAGFFQFRSRAEIQPVLVKETVQFGLMKVLVGVPGTWWSPGIFDLLLRVKVFQLLQRACSIPFQDRKTV